MPQPPVYNFTVPGNVPSKKNSRRSLMRGGRVFNVPSLQHENWHRIALYGLRGAKRIEGTVAITITFFPESMRKGDLSNKAESIMDLFVDAGIIEDDNWYIVPELLLRFGGKDKENPRAEVMVTTV